MRNPSRDTSYAITRPQFIPMELSSTPQIIYIPLIIVVPRCTHLIRERGATNDASIEARIEAHVSIGIESGSYRALAGGMVVIETRGAGATSVAIILRGIIVVERRLVVVGRPSIGVGIVIVDVGAIDVSGAIKA